MDSGLYAACSALMARTQALDTFGNNLANVNTVGFKGSSPFYQAMTALEGGAGASSGGALSAAVNQYGILGGQALDLSPGNTETTGNPLDVAIGGPGFLAVQKDGATVFTRAGNLKLGPDGKLLTASGDPVLGADNHPITLPTGTPAIGSDGTVSVGGATAGTLQLVEFAPGTALQSLGNSYYSAPPGSAKAASQSSLTSGALEDSNVNPIAAEVDLISLQRHSDLLERAMKIFNTDFDQTAAQELPKI